jgi:hypothetical protein
VSQQLLKVIVVRTDSEWESWDFVKLTEALRSVRDQSPMESESPRPTHKRGCESSTFNYPGEKAKAG